MTTRVDRYTETKTPANRYTDFLVDLTPHPNTKDLMRVSDVDSIKRAIRNLALTDKNERLMQPKIGSNIRRMLFEPLDERSANMIRQYLMETIGNYEPRAKVIDITVRPDERNNSYTVNVYFYAINIPEPVSFTLNLYRVR